MEEYRVGITLIALIFCGYYAHKFDQWLRVRSRHEPRKRSYQEVLFSYKRHEMKTIAWELEHIFGPTSTEERTEFRRLLTNELRAGRILDLNSDRVHIPLKRRLAHVQEQLATLDRLSPSSEA